MVDAIQESASSMAQSAFRRSLTLSHGATSLIARRFSRSSSNRQQTNNNSPTTAETRAARRCTIADPMQLSPCEQPAPLPSNQTRTPSIHVRIVPSIENPSRSLIFDIVDRELEAGLYIKIGRFTDRITSPNHISFKSKVVSRAHCELWLENDGKLYLRDTKSSSGTFLNHIRLSAANQESRPTEIKDGDIVQLGVDYQGGQEEIYRSVKMRFEINRTRRPRPLSFNMTAFNNLRNLTSPRDSSICNPSSLNPSAILSPPPVSGPDDEAKLKLDDTNAAVPSHSTASADVTKTDIDECCICLYALAPFQALFVAPCSHSYHYKCIRPLLQSHPGFQCPICRTYSDLEASVAVEIDEVAQHLGLCRPSPSHGDGSQAAQECDQPSSPVMTDQSDTDVMQRIPSLERIDENAVAPVPIHPMTVTSGNLSNIQPTGEPLCSTLVSSPASFSGILTNGTSSDLRDAAARDRRTVFVEDTQLLEMYNRSIQPEATHHPPSTPTTTDTTTAIPATADPVSPTARSQRGTRVNAAGLMEKLKTALFEKRKSSAVNAEQRSKRANRTAARPLSYPSFLRRSNDSNDDGMMDLDDTSSHDVHSSDLSQGSSSSGSAVPQTNLSPIIANPTLSRQSTTHLAEIAEVTEDIPAA
ncbi:uncharacterized protein BYT42DRAFT_568033 [Radiomyces spectabilis]|uniref:uncharacterized protein n=1 Tax=Radiomyces spectabilis TaxID=64574 RepID=UPI00221F2A49|nr:uncharacterized protein BYT42DRAFT_568033 [Radiomyces spectabilis]KAI8379217.1 hypothetical protein BYT42DRAFT_568033 [Radiomyces spectabilis]